MTKLEQPVIVLPHRRNSKKSDVNTTHADHIITVKGIDKNSSKFKNASLAVTEHVVNGIIHSTMEGLKSNMKMNLPIITDIQEHDEDADISDKETESLTSQPNTKNEFSYLYDSREIIDLSPIYENSSEACSSHDDLTDSNYNKTERVFNSNNNEYSTTPVSMSLSETRINNNILNNVKQIGIDSDIIETADTKITALHKNPESSELNYYLKYNSSFVSVQGENIDVKLGKSKELETIEKGLYEEYEKDGNCSLTKGPHIFTFTILCLPFVAVISIIYSLYLGTHTWLNILIHVAKSGTVYKKFALTFIVMISFTFLIIFTVGLSLYASVVQITFSFRKWRKEVNDYDKGFYGWVCSKLKVPKCSPYKLTEMEC